MRLGGTGICFAFRPRLGQVVRGTDRMGDEECEKDDALGGKPDSGGVEADDVGEMCEQDRGELTGKQTADCTGAEIAQLYENEEDGGS